MDRVELTPSHCCTCVNQHDELLVVRGGRAAAVGPVTSPLFRVCGLLFMLLSIEGDEFFAG